MFGFKYLFDREEKKKKGIKEMLQKAHKDLDANQLMCEYEKEVFGWWGGDKAKADAMTAKEIQEKWEAHQKKLRDLGVY